MERRARRTVNLYNVELEIATDETDEELLDQLREQLALFTQNMNFGSTVPITNFSELCELYLASSTTAAKEEEVIGERSKSEKQ